MIDKLAKMFLSELEQIVKIKHHELHKSFSAQKEKLHEEEKSLAAVFGEGAWVAFNIEGRPVLYSDVHDIFAELERQFELRKGEILSLFPSPENNFSLASFRIDHPVRVTIQKKKDALLCNCDVLQEAINEHAQTLRHQVLFGSLDPLSALESMKSFPISL